MPNLNKGDYIQAAIESVLLQTMRDFELIIVDDASTDASVEIARRYVEKDPRVVLIEHSVTKGVSAARNTGIRSSRGGIIGLLDSDDLYAPAKLEKQLEALRRSQGPIVTYCDFWQMDDQGNPIPSRRTIQKKSGSIFGDVIEDPKAYGIKTTILLPKNCLEDVGLFDESLPCGEDLDMILKLSWAYSFTFLDEKLYGYRVFPGNTRNRLPQSTLERTRALIIERQYRRTKSTLTPTQRRAVILTLTKHFMRSSQRRKMVQYGLSSFGSFKFMVAEPLRRKGLGRLLHRSQTS